MCKVLVKKPIDNFDFILFNHLYSRKDISFTIPVLTGELLEYNLKVTDADVQKEINKYIKQGFVSRRSGGNYECVTMI